MASQALTTHPGNAPLAPRDSSPFGQLKRQLQTREVDFRAALASKGISVQDFIGSISVACAQNPDLLNADRASLILSSLRAAQDGLHPDGREAALVIFKQNKKKQGGGWEQLKLVQYMPMVYGLRKKILQARDADGKPIVSSLQVGVVYKIELESGYFLWERGSDPEVQHRPMLDIPEAETADDKIVAAYSIATMADGTRSCEVMRRFEIDKIRQMSQTGAEGQTVRFGDNQGKKIEAKGPWVDWFPEMAKKTVMRRHSKVLPMSGDVIASLGDENDDRYAENAMALAGGSGDAPRQIEDQGGAQIDSETGEVLEQGGGEGSGAAQGGQAGAKAEGNGAPESGGENASAEQGGDQSVASASEPEAEREENGTTKHPGEAAAERLLSEFAEAKGKPALEKLWKNSELDRAAMDDDTHSLVANGYRRHLKRFEPETAGAK